MMQETEAPPDVDLRPGLGRRLPLAAPPMFDDDDVAVFETVLEQSLLVVFHYAVTPVICQCFMSLYPSQVRTLRQFFLH